jgi:hypothetical protein
MNFTGNQFLAGIKHDGQIERYIWNTMVELSKASYALENNDIMPCEQVSEDEDMNILNGLKMLKGELELVINDYQSKLQ